MSKNLPQLATLYYTNVDDIAHAEALLANEPIVMVNQEELVFPILVEEDK